MQVNPIADKSVSHLDLDVSAESKSPSGLNHYEPKETEVDLNVTGKNLPLLKQMGSGKRYAGGEISDIKRRSQNEKSRFVEFHDEDVDVDSSEDSDIGVGDLSRRVFRESTINQKPEFARKSAKKIKTSYGALPIITPKGKEPSAKLVWGLKESVDKSPAIKITNDDLDQLLFLSSRGGKAVRDEQQMNLLYDSGEFEAKLNEKILEEKMETEMEQMEEQLNNNSLLLDSRNPSYVNNLDQIELTDVLVEVDENQIIKPRREDQQHLHMTSNDKLL